MDTLLQDPRVALIEDQNVLPGALPALHLAFGASLAPTLLESLAPGTYRAVFELEVPAQGEARLTTALALDPSRAGALSNLAAALAEPDLVGRQIERWSRFFTESIPRFECADQRLVAGVHPARRADDHLRVERLLLAHVGTDHGQERLLQRQHRTRRVGEHRLPGQPHRQHRQAGLVHPQRRGLQRRLTHRRGASG